MNPFTLGSYRSVATSPLRLLAWEPLTWTILGLWGRRSRSRKALAAVAATHGIHVAYVLRRMKDDESLIDSKRFANVHAAITVARFLVYPAFSERRTYWRGTADNAAFFMQLWLPPVLFGASGGPRKAVTHGTASAFAAYAAAAIVNGDTVLPKDEDGLLVARRIGNYTVTAGLVGLVVAAVAAILTDSDSEAAEETRLLASLLEQNALADTGSDNFENYQTETRRSLGRLRAAAISLYQREPVLKEMLAALEPETSSYVPAPRDDQPLNEVIGREVERLGLVADLDIRDEVYLTLTESVAMSLLVTNAAQNAVIHGRAGRVAASYTQRGPMAVLRITDDGAGITVAPTIDEHRGLGRTQQVLRSMGGQLRVERANDDRCLLIASWRRQK
jgi:hypothetical protein